MSDVLQQAIIALEELKEDASTPKSVRSCIESTISVLNDEGELSIKVSRALSQLEELTDNVNLQGFTRTQLFNVVSLLEVV